MKENDPGVEAAAERHAWERVPDRDRPQDYRTWMEAYEAFKAGVEWARRPVR